MSDEQTPAPQPARPDFDAHNVLAVVDGLDAARAAIADLERHGVESNAISVLGHAVDDASGSDAQQHRAGDAAVVSIAARGAGKGAAAGAGVGGLVGFAVGLVSFGVPGFGPVLGAGIWASALAWAGAGAGVGLTAGGIAAVKQSEAWQLTFAAVRDSKAVVGVHAPDRATVAKAAGVLRDHDPERLHAFDVDGARRL